MTQVEKRIAKAVAAFRRAEGFSLTDDQFEALIDQMALAACDLVTEHSANYDAFRDACFRESAVAFERVRR